MAKTAYYAVARGREVGVFRTWPECEKRVKGFNQARFKKFGSESEALSFIAANRDGAGGREGQRVTGQEARQGIATTSSPSSSSSSSSFSSTSLFVSRKRVRDMGKAGMASGSSDGKGESTTLGTKRSRIMENLVDWSDAPRVFTDGACSGNGKRGAKAGYGVWWGDGSPHNESGPAEGEPTNNRGEYQAAIHALEKAISLGHDKIVVVTDSQLLIKSVEEWMPGWKRRGWKKSDGQAVKNVDNLQQLDELMGKIHVRFEYVAGHTGVHGNEAADRLAVAGARMYGSGKECGWE